MAMTRPCPTSSHLSPTTLVPPGGWPAGKSIRCWRGGSPQKARFSTCWNGRGRPLTDSPSEAAPDPSNPQTKGGAEEATGFRVSPGLGWWREAGHPVCGPCLPPGLPGQGLCAAVPESGGGWGGTTGALSLSIVHSIPLRLFIGSSDSTLAVTPDLRPESVFHCPQFSIFRPLAPSRCLVRTHIFHAHTLLCPSMAILHGSSPGPR